MTRRQGTEVEQVTKQLGKDVQQKKEPWQRLGGEKQWLSWETGRKGGNRVVKKRQIGLVSCDEPCGLL